MLANVFSLENLTNTLYGRRTEIHFDYKPMEAIVKKKTKKILLIQKYDINVVYVKGKTHMHQWHSIMILSDRQEKLLDWIYNCQHG